MSLERLSSKDLTQEFYEMVKDDYPDLDLQDVREIVYGPWRHAKKAMESGELPIIQFKYFGKFFVRPGRAKAELRELKERFDKGLIDHKMYFKLKKMIEIYLNKKFKRRIGNGKGKSNN